MNSGRSHKESDKDRRAGHHGRRSARADALACGGDGPIQRNAAGRSERHRREPSSSLDGAAASLQVVLLVALAVPAGLLLIRFLPAHNVPFVFLVAVLLAAVLQGVLAGVLAAGLSFLAYNFFFIAPTYTFTVADPQEVFALLVFLMVGVSNRQPCRADAGAG